MGGYVDSTVRVAVADDFEEWFCLYERVAAEGIWIGGEAPTDRAARHHAFESYLCDPNAATLLAEVDGLLVGSLGVQVRRGIAELGMMVDSAWRGRGVGSALMEECVAFASKHAAHKLTLEVWPHNTGALGLYRKFGFEQEGLLKRHYKRRNGELWDAITMGLVLDRDSPGSPHTSA